MPANPCQGREIAFEHRAGVDVTTLSPALSREPGVQFPEPRRDRVVIVVVPGIPGDAALRRGRGSLPVVQRKNHDALCAGEHEFWVGPAFRVPFHPRHLPGMPRGEPFPERVGVRWLCACRHAAEVKSERSGAGDKAALKRFRLRNLALVAFRVHVPLWHETRRRAAETISSATLACGMALVSIIRSAVAA